MNNIQRHVQLQCFYFHSSFTDKNALKYKMQIFFSFFKNKQLHKGLQSLVFAKSSLRKYWSSD